MSKYAQPDRRPAVVTGASSGIGAATALALAAAGYPVALGARRTDKCEEVATAIRASSRARLAPRQKCRPPPKLSSWESSAWSRVMS